MGETVKQCGVCKKSFPIENFYLTSRKDGSREARCKDCRKAKFHTVREKNPEWVKREKARRAKLVLKSKGKKRCPHCDRILPLEKFYLIRKDQQKRDCWCCRCRVLATTSSRKKKGSENAERQRSYYRTSNGYALKLFATATYRSRKWGTAFDIDSHDLRRRIEVGTCEATGLPFSMEQGSPWRPSLDRIDSDKGYTKDNTQVVVVLYNYAKHKFKMDDLLVLAKAILTK